MLTPPGGQPSPKDTFPTPALKTTSLSLSLKSLLLPMPQEIKMSGLLNNLLLAFFILSILDLKQILLSYRVSKKSISSAFMSQSYLICATDNSFCFSVSSYFSLFPLSSSNLLFSLCVILGQQIFFGAPLLCQAPCWSLEYLALSDQGSFRGLPTGFKHAGRDEN